MRGIEPFDAARHVLGAERRGVDHDVAHQAHRLVAADVDADSVVAHRAAETGTLQRHHRAVRLGVAFEGEHVFVDVHDTGRARLQAAVRVVQTGVDDAGVARADLRTDDFVAFENDALAADRPAVIVVREGEEWLKQTRRMEWDRGVKDPPRATGPRP